MRPAIVLSCVASIAGHGYITEPPSRHGGLMEASGSCLYGSCLWFNQGCTIGCPKCLGVAGGFDGCGKDQGKPTLPQDMKTYDVTDADCGINPWCAPGSAPIMNPCGIAAGDTVQGDPGNGGDAPPGYRVGYKGTDLPPLAGWPQRKWKVGDEVDASWAIVANHGGGYQYRLCSKDKEQTEACFQASPIEFVGDEQYIQYCDYPDALSHGRVPGETQPGYNSTTPANFPPDKWFTETCDRTNRTAIPAKRISTGTLPKGSTWTRNPIPACKAEFGGAFNVGCHMSSVAGKYKPVTPSEFQFPPAGADESRPGGLLGGFGGGSCGGCNQVHNPPDCNKLGKYGRNNCTEDEATGQFFGWNVVDTLKVPDVPPGEYTVSFRWEGEQTPQIWASCSDVTITA
jgi:hypothetical protein